MDKIKHIAESFNILSDVIEVVPFGGGLINDTYKVVTTGQDQYILQRINNAIFKDVDLLQHNIEVVTSHIREKLLINGVSDIDRKVLRYIKPKQSDKSYVFDGESYWRLSVFIKDSCTYNSVTPDYSYLAGKAFGDFEAMLSDCPYEIGETIPDFHNMELRACQLEDAIKADLAGRLGDPESQEILATINTSLHEMCKAERLYREGRIPKRICHCDTKVNNMLFDKNGDVLCVIDLDTVMPSFVFSDVGDFLRTAGSTHAEDDPDIQSVKFRMDIFKPFISGYLESMGKVLNSVEKENLSFAAQLFPFMQAVRFFTDYLNGDTYYKISYPEHNLIRTKNQLALFASVMNHTEEMDEYIASLGL